MTDPGDATLAAYQTAAQRYLDHSARPAPALTAYLDRVAGLVGAGEVLEIGSGPGWDAEHLERRGVQVLRTDATPVFVARLRAAGHDARLLDVRSAELGGPYAAVLADAVLLHLTREQFEDVLGRARRAVVDDGLLACTLKEGDGAGWTEEKLGLPRYFTYWREPAVRQVLARTGWTAIRVDHVAGRAEPWLYVLARCARWRPGPASATMGPCPPRSRS